MKIYLFLFSLYSFCACNNYDCSSFSEEFQANVATAFETRVKRTPGALEDIVRPPRIKNSLQSVEIFSESFISHKKSYKLYKYSSNLLIEKIERSDDKKEKVTFFDYDSVGKLTSRGSGSFALIPEYDYNGRIIATRNSRGGLIKSYIWDDSIRTEYKTSVNQDTPYVKSYHFNKDGLVVFRKKKSSTRKYVYDEFNRNTKIVSTGNIFGVKGPHTDEFVYNKCGLLTKSISSIGDSIQYTIIYEYDFLKNEDGFVEVHRQIQSTGTNWKSENASEARYTVDEKGNWIHCLTFHKGVLIGERKRIITYATK